MSQDMPVYVKIEDYKEVLGAITTLQQKIQDAKMLLNEIEQLKNDEQAEVESWKLGIEDVEQKIVHLNDTLFKPQDVNND